MKRQSLILVMLGALMILSCDSQFSVKEARLEGQNLAVLELDGKISGDLNTKIRLEPNLPISSIKQKEGRIRITTGEPFRLDRHYYAVVKEKTGENSYFLMPDGILDSLHSDKELGVSYHADQLIFRLFAPRATSVMLVLFDDVSSPPAREMAMTRENDGVWSLTTGEKWTGKFYGYRVDGPRGEGELFNPEVIVADPYSRLVATVNDHRHPGRSHILPRESGFDWQGDQGINIHPRDLIVYEMHVRDLTAHPSAGLPHQLRGSYAGLSTTVQTGGLPYIANLGVNAVELLPVQDFGNIEIPFRDSTDSFFNTWNPYERNHWGYMTSYFFAPETYYATGGTMEAGKVSGASPAVIDEFKKMVRAFHRQGIAVFMDVVYNHVSQYDYNSFKYIDKYYYFRLNGDGSFRSESGCGNDFKTERPMARRLIVESILYWMKEYHIDGFRFDLANLIDGETCDRIIREARKANPNVHIIAEPWGGGYNPAGFSERGWAAWNDRIRNGFKGWDPVDSRGFLFGEFHGEDSLKEIHNYIRGSLSEAGGQFQSVEHNINYLAAHDNHTLGDFIRIALGRIKPDLKYDDPEAVARLDAAEMALSKVAAIALLTSQGSIMIHEGQEYGRSKIIVDSAIDSAAGKIDHNSYEKDDETNWLNFNHARLNQDLLAYYRGLINLRKANPALRRAAASDITFPENEDPFALVYRIDHEGQTFLVALNCNPEEPFELTLPEGQWVLRVDRHQVHPFQGEIYPASVVALPAVSGVIFEKVK
ncbi:MAG TPA: alpha-amylase family glycosyl hydrolase [Calditrichia bacterium]|nr:DUF3459 domain-containing protein [Calditrichota bacterium]HQV30929.1 alpha-amylase family glycosyl hydrolase [Calditrichia bacterium]